MNRPLLILSNRNKNFGNLDSEKQQAINLFLGKFIPYENCLPLWDHPTDYYFHHVSNQDGSKSDQHGKRY